MAASLCAQFCTADFDPVCGTDGVMYTNECELNKQTCKNPLLKLDPSGRCPPPRATTPAPTLAPAPAPAPTPTRTTAPTTPSNCPKQCTNDWNPLCGSDGATYANACKFELGRCAKANLLFLSMGSCSTRTQQL